MYVKVEDKKCDEVCCYCGIVGEVGIEEREFRIYENFSFIDWLEINVELFSEGYKNWSL